MPSRVDALLLALLTLAAFGLRLRGIDYGLPVELEGDPFVPYQVEALHDPAGGPPFEQLLLGLGRIDRDALARAQEHAQQHGVDLGQALIETGAASAEDVEYARADPTADRNFNWYPLLLARVASLWPAGGSAPPDAPLAKHLAAASGLHVRTRIALALLSSLAVPLTWLLARLFLPRRGAWLAAALLATGVLHFLFSQQARPHAPSATFYLGAVLAAIHARRASGWWPHLVCGLACFLAVGCLPSGLLVLPAVLVAYLTREGGWRRILDGRILLPFAGALLAIPAFYPFVLSGQFGQREGEAQVFDLAGHMIFLDQFNGRGFATVQRVLWSFDPVLLVLLAAAVAVWIGRRATGRATADEGPGARRDAWVALAFFVPYLVVFGLYERTYERFLIPLYPYLALAGAWAVVRLAPRGPAFAAAAALVLALPLWATLRLGSVRAAPHTMERAAAWLEENAGPGDDVLLTSKVDLPLFRRREGMLYWNQEPTTRSHFHIPWTRYQARLPGGEGPEPRWNLRWIPVKPGRYGDDSFVSELGADYAVAEIYAENRVHPAGTLLIESLRRVGELVARISPDGRDDYSEHPLTYQEETSVQNPHFTRRLLQARGVGPVIEIYRLRRD